MYQTAVDTECKRLKPSQPRPDCKKMISKYFVCARSSTVVVMHQLVHVYHRTKALCRCKSPEGVNTIVKCDEAGASMYEQLNADYLRHFACVQVLQLDSLLD